MSVYAATRLVHLACMAVWMAAGLLAPADVRESLERGASGVDELLPRLRRTARVMNASAYATVLSGLTLIGLGRGWDTEARFWWGLGLTLLAILVGRVVIRPAVGAIVGARASLGALPAEARAALAARFTRGVRVEDTLRIVVLVLMVR